MSNTLGLDDDLEPVEALVIVEKAFALSISDHEAASCSTVGDIYDLLRVRFAAQIDEPGPCVTSMAFYRIRRSLRGLYPGVDFRPDTSLVSCAGRNGKAFFTRLRRKSGLRIPEPQARWFSGVGYLLALPALPGALIAAINLPPIFCFTLIALFLVGIVLITSDPGALPKDCTTVGALAVKVSALNYGLFAGSGGAVRSKALWDALVEVLSGHSDLTKSAMRPDTLILNNRTR